LPRKITSLALLFAVSVSAGRAALAQPSGSSPGTSKLFGRVVAADGKSPVAGATVLGHHLSSAKVYSAATDAKGRYEIEGLTYGYYDLAVLAEGLFVGEKVVNVGPASKESILITLAAGAVTDPPHYPGIDAAPSGRAQIQERLRGREFWTSARGIAILGAIGGITLLVLAGSASEPAGNP
jgi:hypothetical protein